MSSSMVREQREERTIIKIQSKQQQRAMGGVNVTQTKNAQKFQNRMFRAIWVKNIDNFAFFVQTRYPKHYTCNLNLAVKN